MGRDYSDEDRPTERDRIRRHKKEKQRSRERSRERPTTVENGFDRHARREDKVSPFHLSSKLDQSWSQPCFRSFVFHKA